MFGGARRDSVGKTSKKGSGSKAPGPPQAAVENVADEIDLTMAFLAIRTKPLNEWTQAEVLAWLETIELGEYKNAFWNNKITGEELHSIKEEDMKSLGIDKIGQRKKLTKEIAKFGDDSNLTASGERGASHSHGGRGTPDYGSSRDSSINSSTDEAVRDISVTLKCIYGKLTKKIRITMDIRLSELKTKIREEFGTRVNLKYRDEDGDYVSIRRQQDLVDMFSDLQVQGRNRKRIYCANKTDRDAEKESQRVTAEQEFFGMFDVLLDAVVIIDDEGVVRYCNDSFEKLTQYSKAELVSKNITTIMTSEFKRTHDAYMKSYMKTRTSKIIGIGRDVIYQRKDGSVATVHLEVTEKLIGDKAYFFGTMKKPLEKVAKSVLQQEREVLDRLLVAAIIIDQKGTIHGFNQAASSLLGYSLVDVVGRNVSMLMTGPDRDRHDAYLKRYLETGKSKIIGIGRKVIVLHKDSSLKPIMLSVTEKIDGDSRFFTGILQEPSL